MATNNRKFDFTIDAFTAEIRLDKALATHPMIDSRSQATSLIDRGFVKINGRSIKPAYKTKLSEIFSVELPPDEPLELIPYDFPLDIVYEDASVLVINKPSGLVVHPAVGHWQKTMINALLHHTNKLAAGFQEGRPGLVHRIDKDTSGLLVVAKTEKSLRSLAAQFKRKTTHRRYFAVCIGRPRLDQSTITTYLKRHPTDRKRFASVRTDVTGETNLSTTGANNLSPKGKLAITHYKVEKINPSGVSLLSCQLETGRTHQIRVHLSEMGNPIVADPIYGGTHRIKSVKSVELRDRLTSAPHLMLHAAELGFVHPDSHKPMRFSVGWPTECLDLLQHLGFL